MAGAPGQKEDLRQIKLFRDLDDQHLGRVYPLLKRRPARARATFVMERDFTGQVGFVWSGSYRITAMAPSGASVTLRSPTLGDAFNCALAVLGYQPGEGLRLVVDQSGLLLHMNAKDLLGVADDCPELGRALMRKLAEQTTNYASRVFELAALDVRARLQAELLRLARNGALTDGVLVLLHAPTQATLGAQIGATREAVTRHLKDLAGEGVIRFRRGVIEFTDIERLRELDRKAAGRVLFNPDTSGFSNP
jgi:CRP-like cAMP-binding protein